MSMSKEIGKIRFITNPESNLKKNNTEIHYLLYDIYSSSANIVTLLLLFRYLTSISRSKFKLSFIMIHCKISTNRFSANNII